MAATLAPLMLCRSAQPDVAHGLIGLVPELRCRASRRHLAPQSGDDCSQQLRNARTVWCLDQRDRDVGPFGRGVFGQRLLRLKTARNRGFAVIGGADDQQIIGAHPSLRLKDPLKPRLRVARPAVANPEIAIDARDPLLVVEPQNVSHTLVEVRRRRVEHVRGLRHR
jgi:hypothetical protein